MEPRIATTYEFPPADRGGIAFGLSGVQLGIVVTTLLFAMLGARLGVPWFVAFVLASPPLAYGLVTIGGERLPTLTLRWARWALRPSRHAHAPIASQLSLHPGQPPTATPGPVPSPRWARHLELVEVPYRDSTVGVWRDGDAMVAVLGVSAPATALRDLEEQEAQLAAWGDMLRSTGGTPVQRIGWAVRTSPDEGADAAAWVREHASPTVRLSMPRLWESYLEVGDRAGSAAAARDRLLVIRVQPDRARRRLRHVKGKAQIEAAKAQLAVEQAELVGGRLVELGCHVDGLYTPEALAGLVRTTLDPSSRHQFAAWRAGAGDGDAGVSPTTGMWPLSFEESADHVRVDGSFHRVFWVQEWPTVPVTADWLHPLLLRSGVQRTITMVMEPHSTAKGVRSAHRARVSATTEAQVRVERGFLVSARSRRLAEAAEHREEELVEGHCDTSYSSFVLVSAASLPELEAACDVTAWEAGRAQLELRPLHGQHFEALGWVLPLGRGL